MSSIVERLRGSIRLGRGDGQSLILFAIMVPLLLVFVGFVVDGAHAFVDNKDSFPRNRRFALAEGVAT